MIAPTKPWVVYVRVSTSEQANEGVSLDAQRASCEAMAKALSLPVGEVVQDDESAKDLRRPGISRILADIEAGKLAGLLVYKLDRLTRSRRDLEELLPLLDRNGATLISVSEKLDTSSAMGRFFIAMLGAIAQWERETIVERVTMGMRHRKSQGGFVGGPVPAGLRVEGQPGKRMLVTCPEWGPVVERVWSRLAEGASLTVVANEMTAAKLPGSNRKWSAASIRKLALNPRYVGLLVPAELQERVRAELSSRFSPWRGEGRSLPAATHALRPWPLSGIGRCGQCGAPLKGNSVRNGSGRVFHYYQCREKVRLGGKTCKARDLRAEPWEAGVIDVLVRSVQMDGKLAPALVKLQAECAQRVGPLTEQVKVMAMERDRLLVELRNLGEMAATGGLTAQALGPVLNDRQQKLNGVQVQIARAEGELAAAGMTEGQAGELLAYIQGQIAALPEAEPEDQANAIRTMVAQVTLREVTKQKGEIDLVVNLPRTAAGQFGRTHPMVEDRTVRPNTVGWSDSVDLRMPVTAS